MKKRFLYGILMTFLLVLFLPASTALAIVYGFDFPVDDEYFDNTISDTQGGFTLIISLASENSYVTNYLRYDDEWVVTDPHLMSGQVVTIANTDGADGTIALESDKPITVSLAGNKIFSLNSFVWGNGSAYGDSITISAGSYSKSIPMGPSESQEFIPETSDFQGITSFTISWNDAHEMYFDLFDISLDPIITAQPVNASVEARESVGFSVAAIGNLLSYQWQVDTSGTGSSFADISDGGVYSGATSANLSISGAMSSMNKYQYRCIITGEGGYSTTSNSASLTVSGEEPTDITLDHYSIAENSPIFSKIGTLSSEDADSTDFTYTLVDTASYPDNAAFTISGSDLLLNTVPDYEVKSSYTIKVQTEDESGLTFAKELVIDIEDANDPPTDINLLNTTVAENSALGTAIGELTADDQDAGDSHSFTLVSGSGDTDNGSFIIDGNTLKLNAAANYETQSSYSVRIRVSDGFLSYEKIFVITVIDINEAPTDLDLSNREVLEHSTVGTVIGSFSGNDPDAGAVLSYTFASGEGDSDNGSFQIDGEELKLAIVPDYEVKNSYSIRVRVSDGTLFFEKAFTIEIIDGNDPPVAISLDNASVYENNAPGSVVGNLTASDPNTGDSINFTLAGGAGDTDNASFSISGQQLRLGITADYETKSSYSVRIRATDQDGLYYEQEFTVSILNVNEAPTDIELSKDSIEENSPIGTIIGTLTAIDPDIGDTHQFALVAGAGDTDNGRFTIDGNALKLAFVPDYETKNSYSIRIEASDGENLTFEKQFTITILDGNDEPTDISITSESIPENTPIGIELATLSTTDPNGGSFVYTLVAGDGSTDNDSFQITGNSLSMLVIPDYETKNTYEIRIRTTDEGGLYFEKAFTISVTDVNENPTDIQLSYNRIPENSPWDTVIGILTATDPDAGSSFSYSLVSGVGSSDNDFFTISGNSLRSAGVFDYESKASYNIRIRVTDNGGLQYEKTFTISVEDVNEAPTFLTLSNSEVEENTPSGSVVGTLTGTDPDDGAVLSYSLVAGAGDTDNDSFTIEGNALKLAIVPDYETKSSYSIRVAVSDGEFSYERQFTITITDGDEPPTDIALSADSVAENTAVGSLVAALSAVDEDSSSFTYTLVAGAGSTDNAAFTITGNELRLAEVPDYETKASYQIRIKVTDNTGLSYEEQFTISVEDVNEAPSDITLTNARIAENSAIGTVIGSLVGVDEDSSDTLTYTLTGGTGDEDNNSFTITGDVLKSAVIFDYEAKNTYSIRVRVTDAGGLYYEKSFTISVTDVNENSPAPSEPSTPTPSTPAPVVEKILLDVTDGSKDKSIAKVEIERTTTPEGIIKDDITFTKEKVAETLEKLPEDKTEAIRLVVSGTEDKASEVKVNIPKDSLETLSEAGLNLELETEDAIVSIPAASLETASEQMEEDLYFKLKPITDEEEKNKLTDRVAKEGMLIKLLGDNLSVIGTPMEIETNIPETQVDIVLPLSGITIPDDEQAREELLSKLVVYVEHSDGEKETIKGELVQNKDGSYGLKFTVSKFSTFTLVKDSRVKSDSCDILKVKTPTDAFISGTFIRATLPNKTTKVKLNITVSEGATWKLYSDKACTKEITNNIKLKEGLNKVYIKVTAEDGVSDQRYMVYLIRSNSDK
jgi:hypothetical protein